MEIVKYYASYFDINQNLIPAVFNILNGDFDNIDVLLSVLTDGHKDLIKNVKKAINYAENLRVFEMSSFTGTLGSIKNDNDW